MTYYFLDTTALIYAYVPGCEQVRELVARFRSAGGGPRVVVCDMALPEAIHFMIERQQAGLLDYKSLSRAVSRLDADFGDASPYIIVEVSGVVSHARDWMQLFEITAKGAITVAAALAARVSLPPDSDICLVTTDEDQIDAARAEGFTVCRPFELDPASWD